MTARAIGSPLRRPRIGIAPRAAVLAVVVTLLLLYLTVPLRTYLDQRDRLFELDRRAEQLERENAALRREIGLLHDPAYIERLARECLRMARPGEITFVIPSGAGSAPSASCR